MLPNDHKHCNSANRIQKIDSVFAGYFIHEVVGYEILRIYSCGDDDKDQIAIDRRDQRPQAITKERIVYSPTVVPMPNHEHQERPDLRFMVAHPAFMLMHQLFDSGRVEEARLADCIRSQITSDKVP